MPGLTSQTPYVWLAWLCLVVVGINAVLVAAHAVGEARRHLEAGRALGDVLVGVVTRGLGQVDGRAALATHEVAQIGRALDGKAQAIAFTDKTFAGTVHGGEVEVDGAQLTVVGESGVQVWPLAARQREARKLGDDATFDAHYAKSRGARGTTLLVRTHAVEGDRVWLCGTRDGETFRARVVALLDPRAFHRGAAVRELLFALASLGVFAGLAVVATWPPALGTVSTVGGVLLLAYFLLVQPAGVALEEALRPPPVAYLRGEWRRSAPVPAANAAAA